MYTFLIVLIVIIAVLLSALVLIQNSKGGGLASNFASSNQIMGVRKTTDFLEKGTWSLAAAIVVLSIVTAYTVPATAEANQSVVLRQQNALPAANPLNQPAGFGTNPAGADATQAPAAEAANADNAPTTEAPAAE